MASPRGYRPEVVDAHLADGLWSTDTVAGLVAERTATDPEGIAFVADDATLTWSAYRDAAAAMAGQLAGAGIGRDDLVAVLFPDLATTHVVYLAVELVGGIVVGIGPRSGPHEVEHLLALTGAPTLLASATLRDRATAALFDDISARVPTLLRLLVVDPGAEPRLLDADVAPVDGPARASHEVFLLNSTSGTTGLPKCVEHNQARWLRFAHHAVEAGALGTDEVFLSALPTPFGFGLWTAHFTPTRLGAPTVLLAQWDAARAVELLAAHRVSVFAGVTTQLLMLLDVLESSDVELPALRVVFTGGEAVPYERARRFEERAGCAVLQFYGSNESGALSRTTVLDPPEKRLTTAGRLLEEMDVVVVDPATGEPVGQGEPGQPTCRGPLVSSGYFGDEAANAELFDSEGRLRMPDLAELDADGYLRVVGRVADIIIRGGTNISAPDVEAALARHTGIERVAVVGAPDPTFGERVCAFVVARPGSTVDLEGLQAHMAGLGMARYTWPERLVLLDELPISAGEKVAKGELRKRAAAG